MTNRLLDHLKRNININIKISYIITHGKAQQSGRQTGTTALPLLDFVLLFEDASYSYFPLAFAHPPCNILYHFYHFHRIDLSRAQHENIILKIGTRIIHHQYFII